MQLDSALRAALLREAEAIPTDVAGAVPAVAARVRAHRRGRVAKAAVVAAVVAATVWGPSVSEMRVPDTDMPPARPLPAPAPRRDTPSVGPETGGRVERTRSGGRSVPSRRSSEAIGEPGREETRAAVPANDRAAAPAKINRPALLPSRPMSERYDVNYLAGTHVGENAGTGCSSMESRTGSNDCIPVQIGPDETEISLRIVDDRGILVGAKIFQHEGGESSQLPLFCGSSGPLEVEPGALLLVYVDTSDRCSDERPTTGTLFARIR